MCKAEMSEQDLKNHGDKSKYLSGLPSCHFEWLAEKSGYCEQILTQSAVNGMGYILPLRFSKLPIKRKLTRMMLLIARVGGCSEQHPGEVASLNHITDYIHSLMVTAISRGELRLRSPNEMVRYYLSLASELNGRLITTPRPDAFLRSQVRRSIRIFIDRYTSGVWV